MVKDETKFSNWSKPPELKHINKLDYNNEYVQRAIKRFYSMEPLKIYNCLRVFYWSKCDNENDFNEKIKNRLNEINNIDELLSGEV
jgi:hypothetical protein